MNKHLPKILALLVVAFGGATIAYAQSYIPLAPLPGTVTESAGGAATTNMGLYISGAIKLAIALGAGLAFLFAIIGGTQYVAASINPSAKADALERLQRSLIGLAIILSSYLILNSIDPKLVAFNLSLEEVSGKKLELSTANDIVVTTECNASPLPSLTGKALEIENGVKVVWEAGSESADPVTTNANLQKTKTEANKLIAALSAAGHSGVVTSAYRPFEYQAHLYTISKGWLGSGASKGLKDMTVTSNPDQVSYPECAAIRAIYENEFKKHGLLGPVANPIGNAPHTVGIGVDIDLTGIEYTAIDAFMTSKNIKLDWRNIQNDEVHFEYSATGPK